MDYFLQASFPWQFFRHKFPTVKFHQNLQTHSLRAILMFKEFALSSQRKLSHYPMFLDRRNNSFGATEGFATEEFALSAQCKPLHYPMFLDRRNDSFGASTEEFALSSQRKLSYIEVP